MTYFEWVDNLKKIQFSPMDYEMLDALNNKTLSGDIYIYNRFISHVINTVVDRLDTAYKKLLNQIIFGVDLNELSLEILKYKKELIFIDKILDLQVIKNEDRNIINTNLDKTIGDIYMILENNIEAIDIDGYYISTFEKIMNSDMEG